MHINAKLKSWRQRLTWMPSFITRDKVSLSWSPPRYLPFFRLGDLKLSPSEASVGGVSPLPSMPLGFQPFPYFSCYLEPLQSIPFSMAQTKAFGSKVQLPCSRRELGVLAPWCSFSWALDLVCSKQGCELRPQTSGRAVVFLVICWLGTFSERMPGVAPSCDAWTSSWWVLSQCQQCPHCF